MVFNNCEHNDHHQIIPFEQLTSMPLWHIMHTHDQSINGWKHFVDLEYAITLESSRHLTCLHNVASNVVNQW
jgi:hypothetical protein